MPLSADRLLDRIRLKAELAKWRALAIGAATLFFIVFFVNITSLHTYKKDSIARITVSGIILEDVERDKELLALKNDDSVKALIIYVNSPGGTIVGGETFYESLRAIAQVKPVVAVMGSVAASGGYMVALAADYIVAHKTTITGSIGVMLHAAEITELSQKIGVNFTIFKSGELKGAPSPFETLTPKASKAIQESIKDSFTVFADMVAERRNMEPEKVLPLADGRIFTGRQALQNGLVDALGGENEALQWLYSQKGISKDLPVKEMLVKDDRSYFEKLFTTFAGIDKNTIGILNNNGILALWNPTLSLMK